MSKDIKIYTERDFKEASTRQERIYMKLMQPEDFNLNNSEHQYYKMLIKAWTLLDEFKSKAAVKRVIVEIFHCSSYIALTAIKDAQEILGPLLQVNKEFEIHRIIEQARKRAQMAEDQDNFSAAAKFMDIEVKALAQLKETKMSDIPPVPEVEYSTDFTILSENEDE